jgi:type 1 glutamine amidotransferase
MEIDMKTTLHRIVLTLTVVCGMTSLATAELLVYEGAAGPGKGKKIVLVSGDEEYRSEEALPMLGKILSQRHGFTCTVIFSIDPKDGFIDPHNQGNLPGLEALDDADLMIVATRFRTPSAEQMKSFDAYLEAGKPVIGLRTATHGFRGKWSFFGLQILGEQWVSHHGGHKRQGCRGVIETANADHPVLRGVKDVFAPSDVYTVKNLTDDATVLLRGAVTETLVPDSKPVKGKLNEPMMALAWTRQYTSPGGTKGQAFCTTLGAGVDFMSADARRLVVNAAYQLTGIEVPAAANVDFVDPFYASFYGFIRDKTFWRKRNLHPADFALGKSPVAVDPPGTPDWPFRQMGPK